MSENRQDHRARRHTPVAVILGTNEIASAVAVHLHRASYGVVLSHDPMPPVIRRKMAFHDALFDDCMIVDGVVGQRADTGIDVRDQVARRRGVAVTHLGLLDLLTIGSIELLVDARMHKYAVTPDLRRLARVTIGLGPGFAGDTNCDLAIETRPGKEGRILQHGATDAPDGLARTLGDRKADRFVRSEQPGRWYTAVDIGTRVFRDFVIGHLGSVPVRAPFDGVLRGVVRDDTDVPAGVKLLEIDPRGRDADWIGLDQRALTIARAVTQALSFRSSAPDRARSGDGQSQVVAFDDQK